MQINFNEAKANKIENSHKNTKTLRYKTDTKLALIFLAAAFLFVAAAFGIACILPKSSAIGRCLFGAVSSIITSLFFFSGINYNSLKKYCLSVGIDINDVNMDFKNTLIHSPSLCAVGNKYFICSNKVIPFEKICWIFYSHQDTDQKNGCMTICMTDGNIVEYVMTKEHAVVFLNEVDRKHPDVILGYSLELEKLFASDINEFKTKADSMKPASIYEMKSSNL